MKENNTNGAFWVKCLILLLRDKGQKGIGFDPSTYDIQADIPYCNRHNTPVMDVNLIESDDAHINITVQTDDGHLVTEPYDGSEEENFEYLFYETYYTICNHDAPEAEDWLQENAHEIPQ